MLFRIRRREIKQVHRGSAHPHGLQNRRIHTLLRGFLHTLVTSGYSEFQLCSVLEGFPDYPLCTVALCPQTWRLFSVCMYKSIHAILTKVLLCYDDAQSRMYAVQLQALCQRLTAKNAWPLPYIGFENIICLQQLNYGYSPGLSATLDYLENAVRCVRWHYSASHAHVMRNGVGRTKPGWQLHMDFATLKSVVAFNSLVLDTTITQLCWKQSMYIFSDLKSVFLDYMKHRAEREARHELRLKNIKHLINTAMPFSEESKHSSEQVDSLDATQSRQKNREEIINEDSDAEEYRSHVLPHVKKTQETVKVRGAFRVWRRVLSCAVSAESSAGNKALIYCWKQWIEHVHWRVHARDLGTQADAFRVSKQVALHALVCPAQSRSLFRFSANQRSEQPQGQRHVLSKAWASWRRRSTFFGSNANITLIEPPRGVVIEPKGIGREFSVFNVSKDPVFIPRRG